ncbi:hypothetical protein Pfo_006440 [Paulownia fortunei]|nr:hypothetical protein Pfo_006440 [Paulownia fortunei]
MGKLFLSVLSFLLLFGFSFAVRGDTWQRGECQISSINAREPSYSIQAEGGATEFWDFRNDEFRCAGVSIRRHRVQPRGLMLPVYHNAPVLVYVVGEFMGLWFRDALKLSNHLNSPNNLRRKEARGSGTDIRKLDNPVRVTLLLSQRGQLTGLTMTVMRSLFLLFSTTTTTMPTNSIKTQGVIKQVIHIYVLTLCIYVRILQSFFLAGNPERGQEQQQYGKHGSRRGQHELGNVFRGFDVQTLAEVFGVDEETARKLKGEEDERGHFIIVERGLQVIKPPLSGEEYGRGEKEGYFGGDNGLEETICSAKIRENLDKPSRADVYNPRAGRFSTVNSFTLPILGFLQLSAARGVLYRNAIMSPHWYVNAHSIIYVTRGESRVQIVNHKGQAVFDGQVREGQVVVVPQNFAVVKQAGEKGCEWVAFNTNDNAMINTLSGRTSAIRGLPADVIANAYQISREQAEKLKFSRLGTIIFSGSGRSGRGRVTSA